MSRKRKTFLVDQITKQQKWIEGCESNGRSYTGSNGGAIRQADNARLRQLEAELNDLR